MDIWDLARFELKMGFWTDWLYGYEGWEGLVGVGWSKTVMGSYI